MNLQQYIDARPQKKIKTDIIQRWNERIEPRALYNQGEIGATVYLRDYGKSIAAPKCLQLGALALQKGYTTFAHGFYKKAAQLEGIDLELVAGATASRVIVDEVSDVGNLNAAQLRSTGKTTVISTPRSETEFQKEYLNEWAKLPFPAHMQPGKFAPMQPVDAAQDRKFYIENNGYWGQPKIDGNKLIIFATPDDVFYQSRTGKLSGAPSATLHLDLIGAAKSLGSFILEGELTYLDHNWKEHRTGSQAATVNMGDGHSGHNPVLRYVVFSCPWRQGRTMSTYGSMVEEGWYIADNMCQHGATEVVRIFTAKDRQEKERMSQMQKMEGREGEVWFSPSTLYRPGKHNDETFVRTKYLTEFEAIVTGFTDTTAEGHAFGAMEIADLEGKPLGNVGTGFTREDKWRLMRNFDQHNQFHTQLKVKIRCQGFTESGAAWHARFLEIIE